MDKFLGITSKSNQQVDVTVDEENFPRILQNTNYIDENSLPWVEKYRPKNLDEIAYQTDIIASLKNSMIHGRMQHLLLYGPPGTGKTSTIIAVRNFKKLACKRNVRC